MYGFIAVNTRRLHVGRSRVDLETGVCSRLSNSFASYPEPEAPPHDSVRRSDFRVSRTPHRAAILSSFGRPSPVLLVPRDLVRNDDLRVRGRDRAFSRQRTVVHPLQHDRVYADLFGNLDRTIGRLFSDAVEDIGFSRDYHRIIVSMIRYEEDEMTSGKSELTRRVTSWRFII